MEIEDSPREHRSKDSRKRSREEEKDHRGRDREHERSKRSGGDEIVKERRKDDRSDREKDRSRDSKVRDKERDHDRDKHREKEREREKDRKDRERDRDVEKESDRGRDKDKGKEKSRHRDKEKEKERDRTKEKERDGELDRNREKGKEKTRERDQEKEKPRDRDKASRRSHDSDHEDRDEEEQNAAGGRGNVQTSELEDRIQKMKEDRLKSKSEPVSEVLSWVSKSRKLEEKKNAEKEKALQLSKIFEEQDNIDQGESEDEEDGKRATTSSDLAGVKVLHGLEKVVEGGAVVFTLKDQSILANGDVNEDVDMLENYELGEQKRRDDAYKAAKKKAGVYEDKQEHLMLYY